MNIIHGGAGASERETRAEEAEGNHRINGSNFPQPAFGHYRPNRLQRSVIAFTSRLPKSRFARKLGSLLRHFITPGENTPLDLAPLGFKMRLYPKGNSCERRLIFTPKFFPPEELALLRAETSGDNGRGYVFIDIGANVGTFSLAVAHYSGGQARILAFEPHPVALERLRFNVRANGFQKAIKIFPIALADRSGEMPLYLHHKNIGGSSLTVEKGNRGGKVIVAVEPLLDVLQAENIDHIDTMKLDVEGAEYPVVKPFFEAAPERLWPRMVFIEYDETREGRKAVDLLENKGYQIRSTTRRNCIMVRRA